MTVSLKTDIKSSDFLKEKLRELYQQLGVIGESTKSGKLFRLEFDEVDQQTRDQQSRYHAMLKDVAEQCSHLDIDWDMNSWKRLCVAQFRQDCLDNLEPNERLYRYWKSEEFRIVPSLDGKSNVFLGTQTRNWPKYVSSGFIEWLFHFGAENKVVWSDPKKTAYFEALQETKARQTKSKGKQ